MYKKICLMLAVIITVSLLSVTAFATSDIYSIHTKMTNEQSIVTITRPEDNETTFNQAYILRGITEKENIRVQLLKRNGKDGEFEDFSPVDAEDNYWDVGISGFFAKEVFLAKGENIIRIVAFDKNHRENKQITDLTITVVSKESLIQQLKDGIIKLFDVFKA